MFERLEIGPVPSDESCQQVGTSNYDPILARRECQRFIETIRKSCGMEPEGAILTITSNPHDFGTYYEVAVKYDPDMPEAFQYALKVESDAPTRWID